MQVVHGKKLSILYRLRVESEFDFGLLVAIGLFVISLVHPMKAQSHRPRGGS